MKLASKFILMAFLLSGCSGLQLFPPTPTVTPSPTLTATVTPTPTLTPVLTPTPDAAAQYLSLLPEIPAGFTWKIMPEMDLAVLIPDGWFFKEESREELELDGIYVTKENINEVGRFSTGLTVFIFKDFKNSEEAEKFAQELFATHVNLKTTKEVLKAWDYKTDAYSIHHLRIRAEFPYETEVNQNKIVQYSASITNNSVYWTVFESPENLWEETIKQCSPVLDYIVIFSH